MKQASAILAQIQTFGAKQRGRSAALGLVFGMMIGAGAASGASAQSEEAVQRQRIARERAEALAEFSQHEYACSQRFVVTACMDKAKSERNAKIDSLRRQDEVLDGNERRRRAAERLEVIRQKVDAEPKLQPVRSAACAASASAKAASAVQASPAREMMPSRPAGDDSAARRKDEAAGRAAATAAGEARQQRNIRQPGSAEKDAANRAAATQQRRADADRELQERMQRPPADKSSAAPLPPRPVIPPASAASR